MPRLGSRRPSGRLLKFAPAMLTEDVSVKLRAPGRYSVPDPAQSRAVGGDQATPDTGHRRGQRTDPLAQHPAQLGWLLINRPSHPLRPHWGSQTVARPDMDIGYH